MTPGYEPDTRGLARAAEEIARKNPPVIVAGMHRSGTGMLSKMLHDSGVNMGIRQEGNHESVFFMGLNIRLLEIMGYGWRSVDELLPTTEELSENYSQAAEWLRKGVMPDLIQQHLGMESVGFARQGALNWGWKDPRNSLLLPLWLQVFPGARLVHIVRDGRDVALSLANRDSKNVSGISEERRAARYLKDIELWEIHERAIRSAAQMFETYVHVRYEDLLTRPRKEFAAVLKALDVKPTRRTEDVVEFVDSSRAGSSTREAPEWVKGLDVQSELLVELGYV